MTFIVETKCPENLDGKELEGDREISNFLNEQAKFDGDFIKLTIKKILN